MRLYVGKTHAYDILELDINLEPKNVVGRATFWEKNWGFACARNLLFSPQDKKIIKLNTNLETITQYDLPLLDAPHQTLTIDNRIFFTEAKNNFIAILDYLLETIQIFPIPPVRYVWPNTINYIDDHIYIIFHNHGHSLYIIYDKKFKPVMCCDRPIGFCAHNIWKMNNRLWTCNSYVGTIKTLEGDINIPVGEFPRGVAMTENALFIGVSKKRETRSLIDSAPAPIDRASMVGSGCGIAVFDLPSLTPRKFIPIVGDQIYELRLIGEKDFAHHGDILNLNVC